jgi:hypothetical protein
VDHNVVHILVDILDNLDNVDHNDHNDDHIQDDYHIDHMAIDIVVQQDDVELHELLDKLDKFELVLMLLELQLDDIFHLQLNLQLQQKSQILQRTKINFILYETLT